jgi:hypothetical protein
MDATLITPARPGRWTAEPAQAGNPPAPPVDPIQQMERDDRADWRLLRLVVGLAVASLVLAMASSIHL